MKIILNPQTTSLQDVIDVANAKDDAVSISLDKVESGMKKSHSQVMDIVQQGKPVYGINTGLGALSSQRINQKDLAQLQFNLVRSHSAGIGGFFDRKTVRAIMFIRVICLSQGHSGINPALVSLLVDFIEKGITPMIPMQGSVGASGDLAPLSHMALCLIGEGEVEFCGSLMKAGNAIEKIGKTPASLGPKDGLALINGTAVMMAQLILCLHEGKILAKLADMVGCLSLDGIKGTSQAYRQEVSRLKPHPGQLDVCHNLGILLKDSKIMNSHKDCQKVQDPYSFRCIPQVHGAVRQTLIHGEDIATVELGAVTDNPLLFHETGDVISGGNFHGQPLAFAMDYLAMGIAELASMSERRIEKMMNPIFSGLPAFLAQNPGLESGLMMAQVTAAALVSENKIYCHPASIDSIPTSTDKEDHVSMGVTCGHKLEKVILNTRRVLAIEFICAFRALSFHSPLTTSPVLEVAFEIIQKRVASSTGDHVLHKDIQAMEKSLDDILKAVENKTGGLR